MQRTLDMLTREELETSAPGDSERGCLPLRSVLVHARVTGLVAYTSVRQTFVNPHDVALEATYVFPLPERAAVTGLRMTVAGRVVEGLLRERGEARDEYDRAIAQGQRAAIAEAERPEVFTLCGALPCA